MANEKFKVKSYARRTKSGISRVTGHDRNNKSKRNRNIAIGLGIGTSVLALGLGAKHLAKKKGLKGKPNVVEQAVSFKPSPSPKPKVKPETPEVRQTTQKVVDKAKEIKADKPLNVEVTTDTPKTRKERIKEKYDQMSDPEYNPFIPKPPKTERTKTPRFGETRKMVWDEATEIDIVARDLTGKIPKAQKSQRIRDIIYDRSFDAKGTPGQTSKQIPQGVKNQRALRKVNEEISWEENPEKIKRLRAAKKRIGQRIKKEGRLRDFSRFH